MRDNGSLDRLRASNIQISHIAQSQKEYIADANLVVKTGAYIPEKSACIKLLGGTGDAKYAFVGLNRAAGHLTTFHIKKVKDLHKIPSLGMEI